MIETGYTLYKKHIIIGIVILGCLIYIIRLFQIQVINTSYQLSAENNSRRHITQYPARGLIYDRDKKLLVFNEAAYDLIVIPQQVSAFDTIGLSKLVEVQPEFIKSQIEKAKKYSRYKPSVLVSQISAIAYAKLQEKLYKYPGFSVQTRTLRKYPEKVAAHVLGYVGEVNDNIIKNDIYYKSGDYVGISGIEKAYEKKLRGNKGIKIYLVDVHNRIQGSYKDGKYDSLPRVGKNIITTIDFELQKYGELLMQNKKGSIVVIEPATGEILALVTSPTYNPNLLVGRVRSKNFVLLKQDQLKPLFNRALMAQYPPGSTFKLINALIGLQEEVITLNSTFTCVGGYHVGRFTLGCHHNGSIGFLYSIQSSCNAYYCNVYRRILDNKKYANISEAYTNWRNHLLSFGIGRKLDSDLSLEGKGFVPTSDYFDRFYGKGRWKSLMLISMSIGQGELGLTPFQMANMTAIIANRGYYYIPHIVKEIEGGDQIDSRFLQKHYTTVDQHYYEPVVDGMELVVKAGTGTGARVKGIDICGKTGTAENPHGDNHSIFTAFAPKYNPRIAVSVYVENAGYGSTYAAPIASLIIEKYLNDSISRPFVEQRIINADLFEQEKIKIAYNKKNR